MFRRANKEREMREELELHLQREIDSLIAQGMPEQEARRTADRLFGNATAVAEQCRDHQHIAWLENLRRDIVYGLKGLRRTPAFSAIAILSLALGIGVNAAVFLVVHAFLLKPLDVPRSDRLALLRVERPAPLMHGMIPQNSYDFSFETFDFLRRADPAFSSLFATGGSSFAFQAREGTRTVPGAWVSGDYFPILQQKPQEGRLLTQADDAPGGGPTGLVAVISDAFWTRTFGRDPKSIGKTIRLNGHDVTLVGVLPSQFHGITVGEEPAIFAPLVSEPLLNAPFSSVKCNGCEWLTVMGRLKEGESLAQAAAAIQASSQAYLASATAEGFWGSTPKERLRNRITAVSGATGFSFLRQRFADPLKILLFLSLLVLATTSANLAALLLARSAARQREFAVKASLGASRGRLVAQILTETSLIAIAGALAGIPLMYALSHYLALALFPDSASFKLSLQPTPAIVFFVIGITLLTTLTVGLSPALRLTERSSVSGSRIIVPERRQKLLPRFLLTSQTGLSLLLVVAAVLFSGSLLHLKQIHLGFDPNHLVAIHSSWLRSKKEDVQKRIALHHMLEVVRSTPHVQSAALFGILPFSGSAKTVTIAVSPSQRTLEVFDNNVSPNYFATMKTRILEGRDFEDTPADYTTAIILSQQAADKLFPHTTAVGKSIQEGDAKTAKLRRIVGVVEDSKYLTLRDSQAVVFHPNGSWATTFLIRYTSDLPAIMTRFQKELQRIAPEIPTQPPILIQHTVDQSIATERLFATLSNFFGALALLLMAIGLYGTLAYYTARRTPEIGVRMALGATRPNVVWTVAKENMLVVAAGIVIGSTAVIGTVRFIRSLLYGVEALDPLFLSLACALITLVAIIATLLPALRAARIDPMQALRENN